MTHDFKERLEYSLKSSEESFWKAIYQKAFPEIVRCEICTDMTAQQLGVDRLIYLINGNVIRIDEKKREKDYPDILLEYISVDNANKPGWMEKDLAIDYLAYAFMPSQRVYLLPWLLLRRAWISFGEQWKKKYPIISAQNNTYKTYSVAVPIKVILTTIAQASIIQL